MGLLGTPAKTVPLTPHRLVAAFLQSEGYSKTLSSFEAEAANSPQAEEVSHTHASDLEQLPSLSLLIEQYLCTQMNALRVIPSGPTEELKEKLENLVMRKVVESKGKGESVREVTNVLGVRKAEFASRRWDSTAGRFISETIPCFVSTSVDKTLKIRSLSSPYDLLATYSFTSPILTSCSNPVNPRYLVAGSMDGSLSLIDLIAREVVTKVHEHTKYLVKCVWSPDGKWIATIGYDKGLIIYQVVEEASKSDESITLLPGETPDLYSASPEITLVQKYIHYAKTNPEAIVFLPASDYVAFCCREDNLLRYVKLPTEGEEEKEEWDVTSINLNENGDAWVSFSILFLTLHPTLPILSLQTSTENARILLYPFHSATRLTTIFTTASQGEYSTPRHTWLPDGSGVVVTSDDGIIRLVDLNSRVRLQIGAHGSATPLEDEGEEEGRSERARRRLEKERGSSVIKEVAVWEGEKGEWIIGSAGFDKCIRISTV